MRKAFTLPVAALLVVACSDPISPDNQALSAESVRGLAAVSLVEGFESGVSTLGVWSSGKLETSPGSTSGAATTFLGRFTDEVVTLTIPAGSKSISFAFDLYIIGTWDGSGLQGFGGDLWQVAMTRSGGQMENLFHTSFSNQNTKPQNYPKQVTQKGTRPNGTGAIALNSLGYPQASGNFDVGDATYRMSFTVSNPRQGEVVLYFRTTTALQGLSDESWGLDNVTVTGS